MGTDTESTTRPWAMGIGGVIALLVIPWMVWNRWPPPQMYPIDEQVFTTVDALFSALTSKSAMHLEECQKRLTGYHADGRLSAPVLGSLNSIMQQARQGDWEPAAKRLYAFIAGQRGQVNSQ